MPDDEIVDENEVIDSDVSEDTSNNHYCTSEEVMALFGDISDTPSTELLNTVLNNSTGWINGNLLKAHVPKPELTNTGIAGAISATQPDITILKTAAIYYAASDILISLYHGEELPVQYDVWFRKAQDFLEAYIEGYWASEATLEEQENHQIVKHRNSLSYNQKRKYRRFY